jgi:PilZ domain
MNEQRRYIRTSSSAMVEISHPSFGTIELKAKDLSDGGVFVYLGHHIAPPTGTVVKTRIKRHSGMINDEPIDMRVVHHSSGGVGLMFI